MRLDGVVFLAGHTARSQAYAQALAAHDLDPSGVVLYGEPRVQGPVHSGRRRFEGIELPDLSIPLMHTAAARGWPVTTLASPELAAPELEQVLVKATPRAVIFSGYGGQLVPESLLAAGAPFLHAHSGRLPGYRGSTTIYYSILQERRCSVSVLALAPRIDAGPVYAHRDYPLPPAGMDVDLVYDGAIRADLLCAVLSRLRDNRGLGPAMPQPEHEGRSYYVIHPVLKHLALLSLGGCQ